LSNQRGIASPGAYPCQSPIAVHGHWPVSRRSRPRTKQNRTCEPEVVGGQAGGLPSFAPLGCTQPPIRSTAAGECGALLP
jgi:hypothetical protein